MEKTIHIKKIQAKTIFVCTLSDGQTKWRIGEKKKFYEFPVHGEFIEKTEDDAVGRRKVLIQKNQEVETEIGFHYIVK